MKAEQRKELETNALAEKLANSAAALKSHGKTLRVAGGVALLVVGVAVLSWYFLGGVSTAQSRLWTLFGGADNLPALEKLAQDNRGTVQARAARFEAARLSFQEGFAEFGTSDKHADAAAKIDKARALYDSLVAESKSFPLLHQEALMGVARAEETLCATAKADNPGQTYGSLDNAAKYYKQLVDGYADSFQGKKAAERLEMIRNPEKRAELQTFYEELGKRFTKSKT